MRLINRSTGTPGERTTTWNSGTAGPAEVPASIRPADDSAPVQVTLSQDPVEIGESWPPAFPHTQVDNLLERLDATSSPNASEVTQLLISLVVEAKRLRGAVVRLTADRVSAAEATAEQIVLDARKEAAELRRSAHEAVVARLDDADVAASAVLHAATVEVARREREAQHILGATRTEVDDLCARIATIFDSTYAVLPLLDSAGARLITLRAVLGVPDIRPEDATPPSLNGSDQSSVACVEMSTSPDKDATDPVAESLGTAVARVGDQAGEAASSS